MAETSSLDTAGLDRVSTGRLTPGTLAVGLQHPLSSNRSFEMGSPSGTDASPAAGATPIDNTAGAAAAAAAAGAAAARGSAGSTHSKSSARSSTPRGGGASGSGNASSELGSSVAGGSRALGGAAGGVSAILKARSDEALLRDLKIGPLLGRGSYGRVYKGECGVRFRFVLATGWSMHAVRAGYARWDGCWNALVCGVTSQGMCAFLQATKRRELVHAVPTDVPCHAAHPAGRWKAVTVAVKIIEHSEGSPGSASSGGKRISARREMSVAPNISHPNVVSTARMLCSAVCSQSIFKKYHTCAHQALSIRGRLSQTCIIACQRCLVRLWPDHCPAYTASCCCRSRRTTFPQ
jgi:hypothetical protein